MSWGRVWRLMSAWFTLHASMVLKSRPTLWIFSPAGYTPYRGFCVSVGTKNRPASAQCLHPSTKVQQLYGNTWNLCWTTCKQHTQKSPWYTLPVLGLTPSFVPFEQGKGAPDAVGAALKRTASTDSTSALTKSCQMLCHGRRHKSSGGIQRSYCSGTLSDMMKICIQELSLLQIRPTFQ